MKANHDGFSADGRNVSIGSVSGRGLSTMVSAWRHVMVSVIALVLLSGVQSRLRGAQDWPVYRGDRQLRGSAGTEIGIPLALRWSFRSEGGMLGPPVVAAGKVFVGSSDGRLYCLDLAAGQTVWTAELGDDIQGSPLVLKEMVLAGTAAGVVHAVGAARGQARWTFETGDQIVGGPNVATVDGKTRVVVGSHDMSVYCLAATDGKKLWSFKTDNFVNATPAVGPSGIVFGGCDGLLHVLSPADGKSLAAIEVGSYVAASVAVDEKTAFMGHYGGEVLAIDLTEQKVRWRHAGGRRAEPFFAPPAVSGARVVAGNRDGTVTCLDRESGDVLWRFRTRDSVEAGAVISGSRCVVVSTDGRVYVLDIDSGKEVWSYEIGAGISASPAVVGNRLLVSAEDGVLYLFAAAESPDNVRP